MAERGQPLITPARSDTSTSDPIKRAPVPLWLICLSPLLAILLIPLVAEIASQVGGPKSRPAYPTPPYAVAEASSPVPSAQSASSSSPVNTERYFRAFTAKGSPLAIVLAKGEYSLDVVDSEDEIILRSTPSLDSIFIANFRTNTTFGEISTARLVLIYGKVDLTIEDIGRVDRFTAKLQMHNKRVQAHLDYSRSARGPPQPEIKREVVIVGEIENFRLPGSRDLAQSNIQIEALSEEYWHEQKALQFKPFQSWLRTQSKPKYRQPYEILRREHDTHLEAERRSRK